MGKLVEKVDLLPNLLLHVRIFVVGNQILHGALRNDLVLVGKDRVLSLIFTLELFQEYLARSLMQVTLFSAVVFELAYIQLHGLSFYLFKLDLARFVLR